MDKPEPPENQVDPLSLRAIGFFAVGLCFYVAGFALLARNQPDLAPVVIVGGIVAMFWAFVV